jgi:hypothetical protein
MLQIDYKTHLCTVACTTLLALTGCANKDPNARVTGDGGHFHVSSKQQTVELSDAEAKTFSQIRDRRFARIDGMHAAEAGSTALQAMGFSAVKTDTDVFVVEGEQNQVIGDRWHEAIRAMFKAKGIPLRAKPDHESIVALVVARPGDSGADTLLRVRFTATVWDTNGDSKTTTVVANDLYDEFFRRVGESLTAGKPTASAAHAG